MATILLDGQRVVPKRALALGFSFRHPDLRSALAAAVEG
jgi:NAD dependent epimerase/dehydratase family enzyme